MANVGKNIRLIRKQKNMTQDTLAELLYVSRQTVSNYETGRSNPDIDMLVKIAEVLQTDVNILIFGFPVPLSRKREYIKLGIAAVFLMAFEYSDLRISSSSVAEAGVYKTGNCGCLSYGFCISFYETFFLGNGLEKGQI